MKIQRHHTDIGYQLEDQIQKVFNTYEVWPYEPELDGVNITGFPSREASDRDIESILYNALRELRNEL